MQRQRDITRLEELTQKRATLDALVWLPTPESFAYLTLAGRRALADLATWRARFGGLSLTEFQAQMDRTRQGFEAIVRRGMGIMKDLELADPLAALTELRGPALILAKRGVLLADVESAYRVCLRAVRGARTEREGGLVAAILASEENVKEALDRFKDAREGLAYRHLAASEDALTAAAILDAPRELWPLVFSNMDSLRKMIPDLDWLSLASLARSVYPPIEASGRYEAAMHDFGGRGYHDGEQLRAAGATLAVFPQPVDGLCERYARHVAQLAGMFDPPFIAAAMLATSPLEPPEAPDVLKEAMGVVTRENFFDGTLEIPGLALLIVHGTGPEAVRFPAEPEAPVPPSAPTPMPPRSPVRDSLWYLWHGRWVYRPMWRYLRVHPLHVHTVPHFG